jgi:heavy metal efflux system protein
VGSDVQRPIATVVVWGLFTSAFLTLIVMPALYKIIEKGDPVKLRAKGRRELKEF